MKGHVRERSPVIGRLFWKFGIQKPPAQEWKTQVMLGGES